METGEPQRVDILDLTPSPPFSPGPLAHFVAKSGPFGAINPSHKTSFLAQFGVESGPFGRFSFFLLLPPLFLGGGCTALPWLRAWSLLRYFLTDITC